MTNELRISGLVEDSIVDGPGLRLTVFTQGCPHKCAGCHNPETHDPNGGRLVHVGEVFHVFLRNPLLKGVTFSGGEPFLQAGALCELGRKVRAIEKDLVCYTGFEYEQLMLMGQTNPAIAELLELTDLLIDGPYVEGLRDLGLLFRGSSNQRLLDREARKKLG